MNNPKTPNPARKLRDDALAIWRAGVDAVDSQRLVEKNLRVEGDRLIFGDEALAIPLDQIGRIVVVGGGKAGAGMARGVETALGPEWLEKKQVTGWVNVPEGCVETLSHIWLHGARPAGVNEPTAAGVFGTREIIQLVQSLGPNDLCLCLISGGGSALLPAPQEPVTLEDKLTVTRLLSESGATIEELNTVRKQLSRIKGGGLLRACGSGRMVSLILSDVLGDPLDLIASGPTVPQTSDYREVLAILDRYDARENGISANVYELLRRKRWVENEPIACEVTNLVIGNNATAVDAAGTKSLELGYRYAMVSAPRSEGQAEEVGRHLAEMALSMRDQPGGRPDCLISGGEPVVSLIESSRRGLGGRNQQLVLAAMKALWDDGAERIAILSGGTDGEDGPTDAAGAVFDVETLRRAHESGIDLEDYLERNDAYSFFELMDGLIKTGPTHTNVCDLRVVLADQKKAK